MAEHSPTFAVVDDNIYAAIFTADDWQSITTWVRGGGGVATPTWLAMPGGGGSDMVAINTLNPTVVIDIAAGALNDGSNGSSVTFEFSEDVIGFDAGDLTIVGGTLSDFTVLDGKQLHGVFHGGRTG